MADSGSQAESGAYPGRPQIHLLDLPDELLLQILSNITSPDDLATVGQTSRKLYAVSQQGVLWAQLFRDAGYKLTDDASRRVVATPTAPGTWYGREFVRHAEKTSSLFDPATWISYVSNILWPKGDVKREVLPEDAIPVHFPTLFRARRFIAEEMQGRGPHRLFRPTPEDALPALETDKLVSPNHMWLMSQSSLKYYCACVRGTWAILGGRGGYVNIWYIPPLPIDGSLPLYGPSLALSSKVLDESILSLGFSVGEGGDGLLVAGTSDGCAKAWAVDWGRPAPTEERRGVKLRLLATLEGTAGKVSAVAITTNHIVTGSQQLNVYDRQEVYMSNSVSPLRVITISGTPAQLQPSPITGLSIDANTETTALVGLREGGCRLVDLTTSRITTADDSPPESTITSVALSTTPHQMVAACYAVGQIRYGSPEAVDTINTGAVLAARSLLLSDSDHAISAGYDGRIHFWDLVEGEETRTYEIQGTPIFAIARDGMHLVAGMRDGTVAIITYGLGMPYLGLLA